MKGARTRARQLALQFLYQIDLIGEERLDRLDDFLTEAKPPFDADYARSIVEGVTANREMLDRDIASAARNWELGRMAVVDRNVLRMALFELRHREDIPPMVAIDEAVELGKTFSTEGTGAFVNGILDALYRETAEQEQE